MIFNSCLKLFCNPHVIILSVIIVTVYHNSTVYVKNISKQQECVTFLKNENKTEGKTERQLLNEEEQKGEKHGSHYN